MPVRYIDQVRQVIYPDQPPYQWSMFETTPWTPLARPLSKCRIALLSSGGIHLKDQPPFNSVKNDLSWREIPIDAAPRDFRISHYSKNAQRVQDFNTVFPLERLRELAAEGFVGSLAPIAFTFMGRIFKRTELQKEMTPGIVERLRLLDVDAALLVPV
jgi:D-proline reductase (dithiol) PrdB